MPAVHKLLLEDALQDSPQTRSLLSVYEEDAGNLTDYTNQLLQSMQRVYGAQNEMALATEQLSKHLLEYEKQNFTLGRGDEEVISTLQHFAKSVEELNALHTELATQMADKMVFPMVQFREKDLTEIGTLKEIFGIASDEHEASMVKYSRLPKKKENEKLKAEIVTEVAYTRRKQHQASLQYYCALNALQYRKRVAMLEPMLGYTQAQINFFKKGMDLVSKKMDSFLASVSAMSQSIQDQLESEAETMRLSQRELLSVDDTVYMPDRDPDPVNRTLIQKAGYLNIRNKTGLVTTAWDRLYFFTQGGNLMCQPRGAVAGGMVLDLDNSSVMAVECEDRRYCFQITSPSGKTSMILQAESKKEYEEWICTLNNISRQIYLTDNPEAVAIKLNQTAIQAVTPITSFEKRMEGSPHPDRARPGSRLPPSEAAPKPPSNPQPEDLIAPGTPIQFDILLPASEFQDQNRAGGRRTNPFGETEEDCSSETDDPHLQQVFPVRFLGSMAVRAGHTREVIYEAMRQVLAARAIHNIFRTTDCLLMLTSSCLRLIDPQTQVTRVTIPLRDVRQFAAHQENGRLIGVVVEGRDWSEGAEPGGDQTFSALVFESNTEGEKKRPLGIQRRLRKKERKTDRGRFTAGTMRKAVEEVIEKNRPVRAVAKDLGLSRATIARYVKDALIAKDQGTEVNYKKTHVTTQVFTTEEERSLADYVINCSRMFHGLSVKQTRKLAWQYARANLKTYPKPWDTNQEAGLDWFYGLMRRNPELRRRMPEATSIVRATAFNRKNVNLFFDQYEDILSRPNFKLEPHRLWNLDETEVETVADATRILSKKDLKEVSQISSAERGTMVTMCCCVNAAGASLPPTYIFPRADFKDHMLAGAPNGSLGLANLSGCMNSELFPDVLRHYMKHMNVSKDNPALLVMDNHESHLGVDTIDLARENGLIILTFPPRCSHKLQPLDVSVFGPFKQYFNSACNDWMLSHPGKAISMDEIASLIAQAYHEAFTPSNIMSGYNRSGIYPMNRDIFLDEVCLSSTPADRPLNNRPQTSTSFQPEPSTCAQSLPSTSAATLFTPCNVQPEPSTNSQSQLSKRESHSSTTSNVQPESATSAWSQPSTSQAQSSTTGNVQPESSISARSQPSTSQSHSSTTRNVQPESSISAPSQPSTSQSQSTTTGNVQPESSTSAWSQPSTSQSQSSTTRNVQPESSTSAWSQPSAPEPPQGTFSPEVIPPLPKASEPKHSNSRKRTKSTIVKDTLDRKRIVAEETKNSAPAKKCSRGQFQISTEARTEHMESGENSSEDKREDPHIPFSGQKP